MSPKPALSLLIPLPPPMILLRLCNSNLQDDSTYRGTQAAAPSRRNGIICGLWLEDPSQPARTLIPPEVQGRGIAGIFATNADHPSPERTF